MTTLDVTESSGAFKKVIPLSVWAAVAALVSAAVVPAFEYGGRGFYLHKDSIMQGCWNTNIGALAFICLILLALPTAYILLRKNGYAIYLLGGATLLAFISALSVGSFTGGRDAINGGFLIYSVMCAAGVACRFVKSDRQLPVLIAAFSIAAFFSYYNLPYIVAGHIRLTGSNIGEYGASGSGGVPFWHILFFVCAIAAIIAPFISKSPRICLASAGILLIPWVISILSIAREWEFSSGMATYLGCVAATAACALAKDSYPDSSAISTLSKS